MDERDAPDPLKDLGARIDKADGGRAGSRPRPGPGSGVPGSALSMGFRVGLELVVGVVVGVGGGLLLDRWLGTKPGFMIGGFILGGAAGMVNVYRTLTGMGMAVGYRDKGSNPTRPDDSDEE
jgi:ATP synthase protein I